MGTGTPPLFALYPEGFPAAVVVGEAVSLSLFVPDDPVPQSRPRARVVNPKGGKPFVQLYEEKKSADYHEHVASHARQQAVQVEIEDPLQAGTTFTLPFKNVRALVGLRFNLRKPASYPKRIVHNTRKPDIDNLSKSVLDGLVKGGLLEDDHLITDLVLQKRYADAQHPVGVEIDLTVVPTEVP